jgi:hypothetical protein
MLRGKRGGERHKGTGFSNDRRTFEAITAKSRLKLPGEDGRGKREQRSKLSQQQQCQRVEKVAAQVSFAKRVNSRDPACREFRAERRRLEDSPQQWRVQYSSSD